MNRTKKLAAQVAGAVAIAALVGTSAFADTRHSDATERDRSHHSDNRGSRDSNRGSQDRRGNNSNQSRTYDQGRNYNQGRTYDQGRASSQGRAYSQERTFDRGRTNSQTYEGRAQSFGRNDTRGSFEGRAQADTFRNRGFEGSRSGFRNDRPAFDDRGRRSMNIEGRVERFEHENGGFRVWVGGGRFPIWIPEARIGLFPHLRVGLALSFGGYYDPRGYLEAYDYYNDGYYGAPAYAPASSSGLLRGIVETVDYRRGTLVIRDDASGSFVTTVIRDSRMEGLRPGDYVEIEGDWTRGGVFEGLRLQDDRGRY
jgi:hypothetical protein